MQDSGRRALFGAVLVFMVVMLMQALGLPLYLEAALVAIVAVLLLTPSAFTRIDASPRADADPISDPRVLLRLAEQIDTALMLTDRQGLIVYFNPAMARIFPQVTRGEHYSIVTRSPQFLNPLRRILESGSQSLNFHFETGRQPMRSYFVRLAPLGDQLRERIGASHLVEIYDETQLRLHDRMRRDFIANASHELRTPLAAILGGIETLTRKGALDPAEHEAVLGIMERQARRMDRLIRDLLSLAAIEDGAHQTPVTRIDLRPIINAAIEVTRGAIDASGSHLSVALPTILPVIGDADQIQQVFINIIENAAFYGREGQTIAITVANPPQRLANMLGVTISDEGRGLSPEAVKRVTERFYRVDATTSRNKGGTGLGLAIVKHILRRHGGELRIDSRPGLGSSFTIWLPKDRK